MFRVSAWSAIIGDLFINIGVSENPYVSVGIFKIGGLVFEICHALLNFLTASGFSAIFNSRNVVWFSGTHPVEEN